MNDVDNNDIENGDDLFIWLEGTNEENLENLWSRDTPDEADESELKISDIELNTLNIDDNEFTTNFDELNINVVQMNYKAMHNLYPEETKISAIKEINTILERNTIEGVLFQDIPKNKKIIYIMTRYTEKFKNGTLDKIKSRLLLGGDKLSDEYQIRCDEINARTVSLSSLFTLASLYAKEFKFCGCMDFQSAFLYAELSERDQCYGKIPREESKLIVEINPEWSKFLNKDGTIYCRIKGALYGHPLAPMMWYNFLKQKLALIGFHPMKSEQCVFRRIVNGLRTIICIHVDDGFIGSDDSNIFNELKEFLVDQFHGEGTIQVSDDLEYLNISFKFDRVDKSVSISQELYWEKVINRFNCKELKSMPHNCKYAERLGQNSNIAGN